MNQIHDEPCWNCPSAFYAPDPEAIDLLNLCLQGKISEEDYLFKCAWRPDKICRGLYDNLCKTKTEQELHIQNNAHS